MANGPMSYMQQMQSQRGDDWLLTLNPEQIQRNAKRIVKDICKGSIDYTQFGSVFLDMKFTENLIIAIRNELEINTLNLVSCQYYYNTVFPYQNLGTHIVHLIAVDKIYNTVLNKLEEIKMTGNIGCLVDTPGLVFSDRNHLNTL